MVETVRRFLKREVYPLESEVLRREREGSPGLEEETSPGQRAKARRSGLWGLSTPEEDGDAGLDAVTDPENDVRDGGATAFLVDHTDGWSSSPIDAMGRTRPASLLFHGVRIPGTRAPGEVGQGFRLAMEWIDRGRFVIPSYALGIAHRALEMGIAYAKVRTTFGRPVREHQAITWMIVGCEADLESARWLTPQAAWAVDEGTDAGHASFPGRTLRMVDGQPGHRSLTTDPRRHGLHEGAAAGALVSAGRTLPRLRGRRRDTTADPLSGPAAWSHACRRPSTLTRRTDQGANPPRSPLSAARTSSRRGSEEVLGRRGHRAP